MRPKGATGYLRGQGEMANCRVTAHSSVTSHHARTRPPAPPRTAQTSAQHPWLYLIALRFGTCRLATRSQQQDSSPPSALPGSAHRAMYSKTKPGFSPAYIMTAVTGLLIVGWFFWPTPYGSAGDRLEAVDFTTVPGQDVLLELFVMSQCPDAKVWLMARVGRTVPRSKREEEGWMPCRAPCMAPHQRASRPVYTVASP